MKKSRVKKAKKNQQYDSYWKLTVEYSNIHSALFSNVLDIVIKFIDHNHLERKACTKEQYKRLQEKVDKVNPKVDMGSVRKSINQFIKLGFVKPGLRGCHPLAKKFLSSKNPRERELLFTQIFYEAGSLNSSYSKDCTNAKEINFLLKTLAYNGQLLRNDLIGLMVTDVTKFPRGYLLPNELKRQYRYACSINFNEKKYNQITYLIGFLKYMPDLIYHDGTLEFTDHKSVVAGNDIVSKKRDPILMRLYRSKLFDESNQIYGRVICYACKLPWKGLVASHIKPLSVCLKKKEATEAYNKDNGLLLSPNIDAYFDKFDISFDEDGSILIGDVVDKTIRHLMEDYTLDADILNAERKKFLQYHRNQFYQRNKVEKKLHEE